MNHPQQLGENNITEVMRKSMEANATDPRIDNPQHQESWREEVVNLEWNLLELGIPSDKCRIVAKKVKKLISTERQRVLGEVRELVEVMRGEYRGGEADGPQRRNWSRQGYRQACYDFLSALKEMEGKEE